MYRRYGFRRIETPAVESLELLTGGGGGENEKLIFKVLKRGEKLDLGAATTEADLADLGLRFDLTVPLARYYAQNHAKLPDPLRAVQIGPVWRAERPQQGRYRQFTQCDIDILGVASEIAEIELILATTEALGALGLEGLTVRINDRRLLGAMASLVRVRAGAPRRASSSRSTSGTSSRRREIRQELAEAGHPAAAHRPHAGALRVAASAHSLTALRDRLRDPGAEGAFAALARILEAVGRGGRGPLPASTSTRRWCGAWATTPGRSSRSGRRASPTGSIAGGGRYDGMIGRFSAGTSRPPGSPSASSAWWTSSAGWSAGAAREERRIALLFDEAAPELGARSCARPQTLRGQGYLVALERQARNAGAQRAALEKQGYDGVATVTTEGRASIQWFAERARRQPGSGA